MRTEQEMVAYALEIDPKLLPYVPELLADLEELGSDAELLTEVIADFDLPQETTVIDLGCGKGAVAVEIAEELGFNVMGLELFEPFIDGCHRLAADRDVSNQCDFCAGNILDMAQKVGQFDVAIFAALGDVLGPPNETIRVIRDYVKPGGLIIVSDLYLADGGSNSFPGFEQYLEHAETITLLTANGDVLLKEVNPGLVQAESDEDEDEDEDEDDEAEMILARAQALAIEHPDLESSLLTFAAEQAQENDFIEANFVDAIWVLRKG